MKGEGNPFAKMLYLKGGLPGLLAGKLVFFIILSSTLFYIVHKFTDNRKIILLSESILIALITYSILIFYNNTVALIVMTTFNVSALIFKFILMPLLLSVVAVITFYYASGSRQIIHYVGLLTCVLTVYIPLQLGELNLMEYFLYLILVTPANLLLIYFSSKYTGR
ncbi:MAG: hypothetical protein DRJ47_00425 [Thermoprotei archaeon]|nr:MAG: hypothetical protein DRJ47_00425 [Thermoprotei archaeon]